MTEQKTSPSRGGRPPCPPRHAARYRAALRILVDRNDGDRKKAGREIGISEVSVGKHLRGIVGPSIETMGRAAMAVLPPDKFSFSGHTLRDAAKVLACLTVEQIEALGAGAMGARS